MAKGIYERFDSATSNFTAVALLLDGQAVGRIVIKFGGQRIFLGSFDNLDDAIAARRDAERKYGFGPAHGTSRHE